MKRAVEKTAQTQDKIQTKTYSRETKSITTHIPPDSHAFLKQTVVDRHVLVASVLTAFIE